MTVEDPRASAWSPPGCPVLARTFAELRGAPANHLKRHFNMIDRALHGPDPARDAETRRLDAWMKRSRTDVYVGLLGKVPTCGNSPMACQTLPV